MNVFLWAATVLIVLELPVLGFVLFAPRIDALVGLQAAGGVWAVALMLLAQGFQRSVYSILAVVAALLTFAGGMIFVRFFAQELEP